MDAKRSSIARSLLSWYDAHARVFPWRVVPGEPVDAYRIWLSEVMLQQTTVVAVTPRFLAWIARWPDFASLAAADEADVMAAWAGLGYYARARNLVACARVVMSAHGGRLPESEPELRALPGLGAYAAAAIAAIAFGERAVVVDANVERVVARLFAIAIPIPAARPVIRAAADSITPQARAGDFAQAMMDLGSLICTVRAPKCLVCPLRAPCLAFANGSSEALPTRPKKTKKPQRFGTIFWAQRGDRVLLVRRPSKGLLGGMRALPTGPWTDVSPGLAGAPLDAEWQTLEARVSHGFTHFDLDLALAVGNVAAHHAIAGEEWWPIAELDSAGLPTVFAKAARAMESAR